MFVFRVFFLFLGLPVLVLSDERDAVLLGSAILAATASTGEVRVLK